MRNDSKTEQDDHEKKEYGTYSSNKKVSRRSHDEDVLDYTVYSKQVDIVSQSRSENIQFLRVTLHGVTMSDRDNFNIISIGNKQSSAWIYGV